MDRGRLLFEYRPPRAHPILYAGVLVFGFVLATGALENRLRDNKPELYAIYAAPLAAVLLLMVLLRPSPVRLYEHGAAPSRILLLRWFRPFVPWTQVACAYPGSYDVTGAFVSPFASSDGKVTQTGIALELTDGGRETLRFTPSRFALNASRSRGFREAWSVLAGVFANLGRRLAPTGESIPAELRAQLLAEARRPFLPFWAIVPLFACAAPLLWGLLKAGLRIEIALPIALLAPLGTSLRSYLASRRRNRILDRLSRAAQAERDAAATSVGPHAGGAA